MIGKTENIMQDDVSTELLAAQFSHTAEDQMEQPHALYTRLRNECPIGRSERHGGFWFAMLYDDVAAIARNFRVFSNADGVAIPRHPTSPMYPLELDPPQHTELKTALTPLFHVTQAEAIAPEVEKEVDRVLQTMAASGTFDFVALADYIPATFALRVIGIDEEDRPKLIEWVDFLSHGRVQPEKAHEVGMKFAGFLVDLIARRRAEAPRDDVISALFETSVPGMGGLLTDDQILRTVMVLIFGGLHTTRSSILESLFYIARHPETRAAVLENLDNDKFWALAVDEFLRYSTPTQILKRQVTCPVQIRGTSLAAGDDIMICFGSANRDERRFADPDRVVLDRSPNAHMSFGMGPHRCIGQNLARVFLRSTLKIVLKRMPDFKVPDDFVPQYQVGEARAMVSLPATFTPPAI
jgi:cytochrome P450